MDLDQTLLLTQQSLLLSLPNSLQTMVPTMEIYLKLEDSMSKEERRFRLPRPMFLDLEITTVLQIKTARSRRLYSGNLRLLEAEED